VAELERLARWHDPGAMRSQGHLAQGLRDAGLDQRMMWALQIADRVFWAEIARLFPETGTGDLAPEQAAAWDRAQERVVAAWLHFNHPNLSDDGMEDVDG
jgi:hypothetical protein